MKKIFKAILIVLAICLLSCVFIGCGEPEDGGQTPPAHTHDYKTLKYDNTNHWYECDCEEKSNLEAHKGGTATETEKAICTVCNQQYGSCIVHVHNYTNIKYNEESHWFECACGEKNNMGIHKGGEATENQKAVCSICDQEYGDFIEHVHKFTNYESDNNATYENDGTKTAVCDNGCGKTDIIIDKGSKLEIYKRDGKYIYFGEYPQSIKEENVTISDNKDNRGYYLGSDGKYYAKVVANLNTTYDKVFSTGENIKNGETYYFKVEPIKWYILQENNGKALILCNSIIANKRFDDSRDNYERSEIRSWLNSGFYNKAFNFSEQLSINNTQVDSFFDKVFLMSYDDMQKYGLSFVHQRSLMRKRVTSDYSRATGAYMDVSSFYYGYGRWWLRTAKNSYYFGQVHGINYDGTDNISIDVKSTDIGVVPALQIQL